eukprot:8183324-Alexandrium_andersonii.AAC.1
MSASLVGSEMCIRDRGVLRVQPPRAARRRDPTAHLVLTPLVSPAPTWGPVSYTHLTLPTICSV